MPGTNEVAGNEQAMTNGNDFAASTGSLLRPAVIPFCQRHQTPKVRPAREGIWVFVPLIDFHS